MTDHAALFMGTCSDSNAIFEYLNQRVLPFVVERLNKSSFPARLHLYDSEPIPTNQRNLTDVRNRVALIMEYEFARAMEDYISSIGARTVQVGYVVANKFPDVAVRDRAGRLGLRFELKSIDVASEETAANFDTLIKDIRKDADYVVVLVWQWERPDLATFRVPLVLFAVALSATDLAVMRDTYWLGSPPGDVETGRQGFDLCFAVNCSKGAYNKEEGNFGKLMRLFVDEWRNALPEAMRNAPTVDGYIRFRENVVAAKLRHAAEYLRAKLGGSALRPIALEKCHVGAFQVKSSPIVFIGSEDKPTRGVVAAGMRAASASHAFACNSKFSWWIYDRKQEVISQGKKLEDGAAGLRKHLRS